MDRNRLDEFIRRYEEVYFLSMRIVQSMVSEQLQSDLTHEQYIVFNTLKNLGTATPSDLATRCNVNRSAITAMIDRLVAKGLVKRLRDENDRRVVLLESTDKGDAVFAEVKDNVHRFIQSIIEQLSTHEVESFIQTYEKIANIIRENMRSVEKE